MPEGPVALVLAAGVGARVGGDVPKQFLELRGRPVLTHAVANLSWCSQVVVVHHPEHRDATWKAVELAGVDQVTLAPGGSSRRLSVSEALAAVSSLSDEVAVVLQNGASPNTPRELVERCLEGLAEYDVVQAFVPAVHTIFRHEKHELTGVLPRGELGYSADPTVYRLGCLRRIVATQQERGAGGEMTLDTARALHIPVRLVESPETNVKVTTRSDLVVLDSVLDSVLGITD